MQVSIIIISNGKKDHNGLENDIQTVKATSLGKCRIAALRLVNCIKFKAQCHHALVSFQECLLNFANLVQPQKNPLHDHYLRCQSASPKYGKMFIEHKCANFQASYCPQNKKDKEANRREFERP